MRSPSDQQRSSRGREEICYIVVDGLATLIWLANLAALELHVPQWRLDPRGAPGPADRLVLDLDPGAGAGMRECARVALLLRAELEGRGLAPVVKTSGSKGLQLYVGLAPAPPEHVHAWAKELAVRMQARHPELIVHRMEKAARKGKVLIDWSQNAAAKTTIAPYSLRARERPTGSTPVGWDEVATAAAGAALSFTAEEVLARVAAHGDGFARLLDDAATLV